MTRFATQRPHRSPNPNGSSGFLKQLSKDLMAEFPDMKGFSRRNLEIIRRWYLFYSQGDVKAKQPASLLRQQPVAELVRIPWWHNVVIIQKCSTLEQALFYVQKTVENNILLCKGKDRVVTLHHNASATRP